jgi:ATP-binding cassette subfamily F protein 3
LPSGRWIFIIGRPFCGASEVRVLKLTDVVKEFGDRRLFDRISWQVRPGSRTGLCGENGAGKTTLLRMMAGEIEADGGNIKIPRGTTFGYLPQEGLHHQGRSLFQEVRSGLDDLAGIETELRDLEPRMAQDQADDELLTRYGELTEMFRLRGGYTMDADTSRILKGLGFSESDFHRPCEEFSGGWQMRIALARLLLKRPTLLLLDEPTNHLDLPARDWLEGYLTTYPFAVILVSHDRWFLESVVDRIVEIWNGCLTEYPGNYSRYEAERDRREAALREAKARQDEEVARVQAFIDRFRYQANKAAQVQSRVKALQKIVPIQIPPSRKKILFRFPDPPSCGEVALALEEVEHGYGALSVLGDVDLVLRKRERVALVGANGAGKSTLMRVLSGAEAPRAGSRTADDRLKIAYFAQDQARTLDPTRTVLESILDAAPLEIVPRTRDILGTFLFHGDDVHKPVSVLSGGEKNRLALAILLLRPANLLLLDEPTNHLDLASKDVLLASLQAYTGTIVFVSHDRHFVDGLATRVLEIGDRKVTSHPGNYADFLRDRAAAGDQAHQVLRVERLDAPSRTQDPAAPNDGKRNHEERRDAQKAQRRQARLLAEAEARVEAAETELAELEAALADPDIYHDSGRFQALTGRHTEIQAEIAAAYAAWEALGTG